MAKASTSDMIMPAGKMKPLLTLSKKEPVQAAIGLTADGEGLLLLDKKASPRKVMSMLRANAEKAKVKLNGSSLRFGRAEVDVDYDPGVVRLFINKDAPGVMRLKLNEVVKRIPYQKVEINVDPSLEEDGEREDGQSGDGEALAAPAAASPPDLAGLTRELRELIGRIPVVVASFPARKAELTKLAFEAGSEMKGGRLDAAAGVLATLRAALDAVGAGRPNGGADWPGARQAWQDANDAVNDQINALRSALLDRAKGGDDDADDYAEALMEIAENGLNAITEDHRVKLMAAVMELGAGGAPAMAKSGAKSVAKALGHVQAFQAFLAGSAKIEVCDGNPFGAAVAIRATLDPALQRMVSALQAGGG